MRADYFINHDRRQRFPWSLYHRPLSRALARLLSARGPSAEVLIVGCGLEPFVPGGPADARYFGCDVDADAIEACGSRYPAMTGRLAICPSAYELPDDSVIPRSFDAVVAKEVIEHLSDPVRWARLLCTRLRPEGDLLLSTPNYGPFSSLGLIERTVLEALARRDGYTRADIHPSRFDRAGLEALDLGQGMRMMGVITTWNGWALVGHWRRLG